MSDGFHWIPEAAFGHGTDICAELVEEILKARVQGRAPLSFQEVEQQVDQRRRENRRLEPEWKDK